MRPFSLLALAVGLLFLLTRCHRAETVGLYTPNDLNALNVLSTDTFSIKTSTVALDSVPTFEPGVYNDTTMLVGRVVDPLFGALTAKSFFQVKPTSNGNTWDLSRFRDFNQVLFDSIVLYLKYNNANIRYEDFGLYQQRKAPNPSNTYYQTYGDTLQPMTLQVFALKQDLLKNSVRTTQTTGGVIAPYFYAGLTSGSNPQGLFNTSNFKYSPDSAIGTINFIPRPRSTPDSLLVRLPNQLGKTWFDYAVANNPRLSTDLNFIQYFKGLVLAVKPGTNGSILSFSPSRTKIKLYYRQNSNGVYINQIRNFDLNYQPNLNPDLNSTLFNQILADRTGTPLAGIKPFVPLPVSKTGNSTYIQSGSGLLTKIEFPYLASFYASHQNLVVNKAELIIESKPNSYNTAFRLPTYLQLYSNNFNSLNAPTAGLDVPIIAARQDFIPNSRQDAIRQYIGGIQFGYYQFYLTEFIGNQIRKPIYDGTALFLGTPEASMSNSLDRLLLNNPALDRNSMKLRIFFTQTTTIN